MGKLHIDLSKTIKQIEITTRDLIRGGLSGGYRSTFRGMGLEFAGYREYTQNDDASEIDWMASRRANQLLVKEFTEERNLNVFFLVDTSASMMYGSTFKLKNEYAAEFIASFAYVMLEQGDAIGYAFFNEIVHRRFPPINNKIQFYQLSKDLEDSRMYGGRCNLRNALHFITNFLPKNTMIFIVSDFIGITEDYTDYLNIAAQKFDLIAVMVRDPRDRVLPSDKIQVMVRDPFSKQQMLFNPQYIKEEYEELVRMQEESVKRDFFKRRADFLLLTTDKPFVTPLIDFFKRRQRRFR